MYAGGGYAKSPNPKELSKPKLVSPPKKEKKINENKNVDINSSLNVPHVPKKLSFSHGAHTTSAPQLTNVPFQSYPSNMMPNNMVSGPNMFPVQQISFGNPYYGQVFNMNPNILFPHVPTMTRDEANEDLKMKLNLK